MKYETSTLWHEWDFGHREKKKKKKKEKKKRQPLSYYKPSSIWSGLSTSSGFASSGRTTPLFSSATSQSKIVKRILKMELEHSYIVKNNKKKYEIINRPFGYLPTQAAKNECPPRYLPFKQDLHKHYHQLPHFPQRKSTIALV